MVLAPYNFNIQATYTLLLKVKLDTWYCFSSLRFVDICLLTALLRSRHNISVGLKSRLWLGLCNSFLRSLSHNSQIQPNLILQTDDLKRVHDWVNGCNVLRLQNKPKLLPLHHRAWPLVRVVCADMFCLFFVALCLMAKTFPLWVHLSCGLMKLGKLKLCYLIPFLEKRFSCADPSNQAILVKPFYQERFTMLTEASRVWDVALVLFFCILACLWDFLTLPEMIVIAQATRPPKLLFLLFD